MAQHRRNVSAFSFKDMAADMAADNPLNLSAAPLRMRPRSPTKSPSRNSRSPTRSRITDDIFEDLSPAKILERFMSASGELAASIEAASPDQRQFGIRAAVASKKIEEWANEVGGWPWPKKGADGFIAPAIQPGESRRGVRGRQNDRDLQRSDDTEESGSEEEYWGSLPADLVRLYTYRISDIFDDMDDLDIEEIKNNVLDLVTKDARPSSSYREPTLPGFTNLNTFTGMITHTVLDALPKLNRLRSFLDIWTIRIDILRDVPETLATLCDAENVLQSLWESLVGSNQSLSKSPLSASASHDEEHILTRSDYEIIKDALQRKVTAAATKIDSMLDRLDGRQDTVPDAWLDRMDLIETEYGNWSVAAERKVLEGEWSQRAARETKEMEAKQTLAKQESLENATVLDNGSEAIIGQADELNLASDDGLSLEGARDHLPSVPVSLEPFNSSLDVTRSPGNAALIFGPGLDDGQDEKLLAATAPSSKSIEGGISPLLIGVDHKEASAALPETRSRSTERPLALRMSPSSSVERGSPLPRLPLPYQVYTADSGPTSPEFSPSSPRIPRSSPTTSLRPLLLNRGVPAIPGDLLPSPNLHLLRSKRSSIVSEEWNIVDTEDLDGGDSPIGDSQPSPRSPIFPPFRGRTLFSGSRSSSISLGPSPSKRRSESLFGNSEELAVLAMANDSTLQRANGPPVGVSPHKKQGESWESMKFRDVFSPTCQLPSGRNSEREIEPVRSSKYRDDSQSELSTSASDPFMDETKSILTRPTTSATRPNTSATPSTPPPMFASKLTHAVMSPSNQPDITCYYSDDDYPMSPTKKQTSPSRKQVLDDGGAPRSPKKIKKPLKERTWSESSASGEGDGSPRSPVHRRLPRSRRPVSIEPSPVFNIGNPWTSIEASRPASPVKNNVGLGFYDEQQALKTVDRSRSRSPNAPTLACSKEEQTGSWEPKPTHETYTSNIPEVESIELDVPASIAKEDHTNGIAENTNAHTEAPDDTVDSTPATSSGSVYSQSDTSPKVQEAEPAAYGNAIISPVKARGNWPNVSGTESSARVSRSLNFDTNNILEARDEAKKLHTRDRQSPDNYQLDGAQSDRSTYYSEDEYANSSTDGYSDPPMLSISTVEQLSPQANQLAISQRNSIVSVSSTDATGLTPSHAISPSKLSVFNYNIALESPRIVENLVSDDEFNVDSPTAARRSSFYDSAEIRESIEKDFSAPNTPQYSPQMSHTRESTDEIEPLFSELSENLKPESSALEAPSFSNVDVDLASPHGGPTKVSNDQLRQQICSILESIPAKIELSTAPISQQKPPAKLKQAIRKRPSHASLSPVPRPIYSRASTPSFTLAPAQPRTPRRRVQNNSDIQLYHLMHSTGKPPIKLFVRLVGERGERVMVRVGGGWADLGEYLKEYASHHGRRAERDEEINIEIPAANGRQRLGSMSSMSSLNPAPGLLMTGPNGNVWSSPVSRPGSSMGGRPTSSLQVRKRGVRKSEGVTASEDFRSPSMPLPFTNRSMKTSAAGDDLKTPPVRSVSRQAWSVGPDGEEVHLGPAGPKKNKGDLDEGRKRWVDGVVERIRQVSVEKPRAASGGTKRLFRKKET